MPTESHQSPWSNPLAALRRVATPQPTRTLLLAVLYAVGYLLLERVSNIQSVNGTEISPWEPAIAVLVAVQVEFGGEFMALAVLLPWLSEIMNRGAAPLGLPALSAMLCVGVTYAGVGFYLRRALQAHGLSSIRGFLHLLAASAIGGLVSSVLFAEILRNAGALGDVSYLKAVAIDCVGDMSGLVVGLPLLLRLRTREDLQLPQLRVLRGELALPILLIVVVIALTITWFATTEAQMYFLCFVPVTWIALRFGPGITAMSVALLQVGAVLALARQPAGAPTFMIQLLMLALAGAGQFLSISVTHGSRLARLIGLRDEQLAQVNRAAGLTELTSAIAHELNNPLTAVRNYVRAASLIVERTPVDHAGLQATVQKALAEANRSVEVLRDLRAFYRGGAARKQILDVRELIESSLGSRLRDMRLAGISCSFHCEPGLAPIEADPVQLGVVLHNLVGNACEAVRNVEADRRVVEIVCRRARHHVHVEINDKGVGIAEADVQRLFWPLSSSKPSGLGLGLAISRSLVEANGGRIWLERTGPGGTSIVFSAPISNGQLQEQAT